MYKAALKEHICMRACATCRGVRLLPLCRLSLPLCVWPRCAGWGVCVLRGPPRLTPPSLPPSPKAEGGLWCGCGLVAWCPWMHCLVLCVPETLGPLWGWACYGPLSPPGPAAPPAPWLGTAGKCIRTSSSVNKPEAHTNTHKTLLQPLTSLPAKRLRATRFGRGACYVKIYLPDAMAVRLAVDVCGKSRFSQWLMSK